MAYLCEDAATFPWPYSVRTPLSFSPWTLRPFEGTFLNFVTFPKFYMKSGKLESLSKLATMVTWFENN